MRATVFPLTAALAASLAPSLSIAAQSVTPAPSVMYAASPLDAGREPTPYVVRMTLDPWEGVLCVWSVYRL